MHEKVGAPLMWTVQARHWAAPQPYLVPVRSSRSRRTQSSGMSSGASTVRSDPLMQSVYDGMDRTIRDGVHVQDRVDRTACACSPSLWRPGDDAFSVNCGCARSTRSCGSLELAY